MTDLELTAEEVATLKRLLVRNERSSSISDLVSDEFYTRLFDRPHALLTLILLVPEEGEKWNERDFLLWLELVEKTCQLVYGVPSPWDAALGFESPAQRVRADVEADELERAPEPASLPAHAETDDDEEPEAEELEEPDDGGEPLFPSKPYEPLQPRIESALADGPLTKDELYEALGQKQGVGAKLSWMVRKDELLLDDDGYYRLADEPSEPEPVAEPEPDEEPVESETSANGVIPDTIDAREVTKRALALMRDDSRTFGELKREAGVTADLLNQLRREGLVQRVGNRYALSNEVRLKMEVA